MTANKTVIVGCLSLSSVIALVRATAYAVAMEAVAHVEWVPFKESRALNALYFLMPWKGGPGTVEVIEKQDRLELRAKALSDEYMKRFWERVARGPDHIVAYLKWLADTRDRSLETVTELHREVRRLNQEMSLEAADTVRTLTLVKTVATITVEVYAASLVIVAGAPMLVGTAGGATVAAQAATLGKVALAYSIVGNVAKDLQEFSWSSSVFIDTARTAWDGTKEVLKDKSAELFEKIAHKAMEARLHHEGVFADAEKKIAELSADFANKASSAKKAKLARQMARAGETAGAASAKAGTMKLAQTAGRAGARFLPMLWAGLDVISDVGDLIDADKEYTNIRQEMERQ